MKLRFYDFKTFKQREINGEKRYWTIGLIGLIGRIGLIEATAKVGGLRGQAIAMEFFLRKAEGLL